MADAATEMLQEWMTAVSKPLVKISLHTTPELAVSQREQYTVNDASTTSM